MEDISLIINQLGEERDLYYQAVSPPIMQTSNFAFKDFASMRSTFEDEYAGDYIYTKAKNPTVDMLRLKLAALQGAEDALVTNSGSSAIFCSILANVKAGDHIISVRQPYSWARNMFEVVLPKFNITHTYVDGKDIRNFEEALQENTTLIYLESPNSFSFELQDLEAVGNFASARGITTIIDNSYCTPLFQNPHAYGIDLCLHSATKYISGHSDTVAGVITGSKARLKKIFDSELSNSGTSLSPFNAWLLLRGLRTLPIRLKHITESTMALLPFLKNHPKIEKVIFPFDTDFPQYELARKQMTGACGLLTIVLPPVSYEQIEQFATGLKHFLLAVSWGGHESLVMPKAAGIRPENYDSNNEEHRMVRLYIGLESVEELQEDLTQALEVIS
ncbi:trans-sulfuration enzyme family protein [Flectobacillus rivi]|uniref:Aminotransferase class I/II-fold pyridoxal phosphate-dependent enzyme n=1 Tax=Flectobacillus rivi TaxID=2984209 RepID=A0ABT6YXY2_9BACT|nr:aminotransferase class I/II-fold pyridoxal phosphate-dependent enzyme [Flectobacillus rivi]MDI9873668.1 aminotransferase class I/II-fold pyridoxal phosphate-dependent enzyme [Flectobacillus rivi]